MLAKITAESFAMPLPAAAAAAYAAFVSALPSAAPAIGMAAFTMAIIASHDPNRIEETHLKGNPEAAAECVRQNVTSHTRLAAVVQPLYGMSIMGLSLKAERTGDTVLNIVIQEEGTGSRAEFRPLTPPDQQPDILGKLIAGC
jgi:hypothetical protein